MSLAPCLAPIPAPATSIDVKTGLGTREAFLATAQRIANENHALTLLDIPGLTELCASLPPEHADKLLAGIGASIEKSGASAAEAACRRQALARLPPPACPWVWAIW